MHSLPPVRASRPGVPSQLRISSQIRRFGMAWAIAAMIVLAGIVGTRWATNHYRDQARAASTTAIAGARAQQELSDAVQQQANDQIAWRQTHDPKYRAALTADRDATAVALAAFNASESGLPRTLAGRAQNVAGQVTTWMQAKRPTALGGFTLQRRLNGLTTGFNANADAARAEVSHRAWVGDALRLVSTVIGLLVLLVGGALVLQKAWRLAVEADGRRERESRFNQQIEAILAWSSRAKAATTRSQLIGYAHMAPREAMGVSCLSVAEGAPPRHNSHGLARISMLVDDAGEGLHVSVCFAPGRGDELDHHTLDLMLGHLAALWRTVLRQEDLERAAGHDALTGLPNRRTFESELRRRVGLSKRRGLGFTLAMVDLDHFKAVNDSFGHPEGDAVLRRAGEAIRLSLRGSDRIFRLGGEEFALLLETTDDAGVDDLLNRAREAVKALGVEPTPGTRTSASIGWAVYPDDADDRAELMDRADKALYLAKESGRDRVQRTGQLDAEAA